MAELKPRQLVPSWRTWLVFLAASAVVLVGVATYMLVQPTVYSASAVVALRPRGQERPPPAEVVLLTAPRYVVLATSPYVLNQVAQQLKLDPEELANGVTVTVEPNTANLTIKVTLRNREATATVANVIADAVIRRAGGDSILAGQILSRAVEPPGASGPNQLVMLSAGGVAAVVVGAGAAGLFDRHMRRRARLVRGVAAVRPIAVSAVGGSSVDDRSDSQSQPERVVPEERTTLSHEDDRATPDRDAAPGDDHYSSHDSDRAESSYRSSESDGSDEQAKKDKSSSWWPA